MSAGRLFAIMFAGLGMVLCQGRLSAQQAGGVVKAPEMKIKVESSKGDALYQVGEEIRFNISVSVDGKPVAGKTLNYNVSGDHGLKLSGTLESGMEPVSVNTGLKAPGFVLCRVSHKDGGKTVSGIGGAGVDPLLLQTKVLEPADFDEFWNKAKEELGKVPVKAELVPVEVKNEKIKDKVKCFDVKVACAGSMPVSGYLAMPADAKPRSCPALVSYHGAGVRSSNMPLHYAVDGFIAFDVNAHGIENGKPAEFYEQLRNGGLKGYSHRDSDKLGRIYFHDMYLRVIRALEYVKSLPEWDGRILVAVGTSQGGGQALVAAGIDPQVSCCVAYVPALCHHTGVLENITSGWPRFIAMKDGRAVNEDVVKTVPYYDAAIFAKRIKNAACLLSTGFVDTTCPPTSVYVAYNNIPSQDKRIINTPGANHSVPRETYAAGSQFIREHVQKMRGEK